MVISIKKNTKIYEIPDNIVSMVMTQTNYSEEEATKKLEEFYYDHIKVIRDFMGLNNDTESTKTTSSTSKTKSQERYRVIREEIYKDNYKKQLQNKN